MSNFCLMKIILKYDDLCINVYIWKNYSKKWGFLKMVPNVERLGNLSVPKTNDNTCRKESYFSSARIVRLKTLISRERSVSKGSQRTVGHV